MCCCSNCSCSCRRFFPTFFTLPAAFPIPLAGYQPHSPTHHHCRQAISPPCASHFLPCFTCVPFPSFTFIIYLRKFTTCNRPQFKPTTIASAISSSTKATDHHFSAIPIADALFLINSIHHFTTTCKQTNHKPNSITEPLLRSQASALLSFQTTDGVTFNRTSSVRAHLP